MLSKLTNQLNYLLHICKHRTDTYQNVLCVHFLSARIRLCMEELRCCPTSTRIINLSENCLNYLFTDLSVVGSQYLLTKSKEEQENWSLTIY